MTNCIWKPLAGTLICAVILVVAGCGATPKQIAAAKLTAGPKPSWKQAKAIAKEFIRPGFRGIKNARITKVAPPLLTKVGWKLCSKFSGTRAGWFGPLSAGGILVLIYSKGEVYRIADGPGYNHDPALVACLAAQWIDA